MSSTSRGGDRNRADNYPTPAWCVWRVLESVRLPEGKWLEPCAGDGDIVRAANVMRAEGPYDISCPHLTDARTWRLQDIRPECLPALAALSDDCEITDFLKYPCTSRFDIAITNPPYLLAREFAEACMEVADHVLLLLRLNFLGGAERNGWLRESRPDVYVLPQRPSFANKCRAKPSACKSLMMPHELTCTCGAKASPQTDSVEYAWFHWHEDSDARYEVLPLTPIEERKIWLTT